MGNFQQGVRRMNETSSTIKRGGSPLDAFTPAIEHTKRMLFQPFDPIKWFVLGFVIFLASLITSDWGGGWGGSRYEKELDDHRWGGGGAEGMQQAGQWVMDNLGLILFIGIAAFIAINLLGVVIQYLGSRGHFMFLECVIENKAEVAVPWKNAGRPAWSLFLWRMAIFILLFWCFVLLLALPAGMLSAYRSNSAVDRIISTGGFATVSVPSFVMALAAIYLFSVRLQWLPATGYTPFSLNPWANLKSFVLPALSIALIEWVVLMRVLRSDMITTLQQNYILLARAKGLPPWKILIRHALRPSSFTLLTVFGLQVGRLLGEAVIVETIFALPGMGRLLVNAIYARDYMVVQGCVLLITIGYVTVNSAVDIFYAVLDPRIRMEAPHGG